MDGTEAVDGCRMQSFRQVYKNSPFSDAKFLSKLSALDAGIAASPQFRTAQRQWRACMQKGGLNFRSLTEAISSFEDRLRGLNGSKKTVGANGQVVITQGNKAVDPKALAS